MKVEDLDVFKLSHELTIQIYKATEKFPDGEKFGLTSQMRRSSASGVLRILLKEGIDLAKRRGRAALKRISLKIPF